MTNAVPNNGKSIYPSIEPNAKTAIRPIVIKMAKAISLTLSIICYLSSSIKSLLKSGVAFLISPKRILTLPDAALTWFSPPTF